MARAGAGGTERVPEEERRRKGKRDPIVAGPHRLPSVGVHTYILYSIYYRIYTIYTAVYCMLSVPSCVVHDIDLLIMVPFAGCLLDCSVRTGSLWFGFHFDTFSI